MIIIDRPGLPPLRLTDGRAINMRRLLGQQIGTAVDFADNEALAIAKFNGWVESEGDTYRVSTIGHHWAVS